MLGKIKAIAVCMGMLLLAGCGSTAKAESNDKKLSIVCTTFSGYDWAREITAGTDNCEITYLLTNGVDMHSYQPTAEDIMMISKCDMFIYVGGESEEWAEDALAESINKDMKVIKFLDVKGLESKEEEVKEGMQGEEEEENENEDIEYDEHVWLSLRNAEVLCGEITRELCELDSENENSYRASLAAYTQKLDKLDNDIKTLVDSARNKTLIFGDRFPFRYFVDDYGLDYYAAFVGCSAETQASFDTITFLAKKVNETGVDTVFTIENSDSNIAQAVIENTDSKDQKIAVLDSIQSVDAEHIHTGTTYYNIMEKNYETLKEALE